MADCIAKSRNILYDESICPDVDYGNPGRKPGVFNNDAIFDGFVIQQFLQG